MEPEEAKDEAADIGEAELLLRDLAEWGMEAGEKGARCECVEAGDTVTELLASLNMDK